MQHVTRLIYLYDHAW